MVHYPKESSPDLRDGILQISKKLWNSLFLESRKRVSRRTQMHTEWLVYPIGRNEK